ncbi:MAG TPA: hypothetical protein VH684_24320 [Xanthobacteraceae bacterium]|jgi:hypothetical protein
MDWGKSIGKLMGAIAVTGAIWIGTGSVQAWDDAKYPDWKGQWERIGGGAFDADKRPGLGQQAPVNPEYMAIWRANLAEEASGGQSYNPMAHCISTGMPRMMVVYQPMEIIVTPQITYIPIAFLREQRRIYTDGRDWPQKIVPTLAGYSIGRWLDEDGDGRYDVLEVETRGMRGPRVFDGSGIPLHRDNATIIKERFFLDRSNPNMLRDEITVMDHALTRPWTVTRKYSRNRNPIWLEDVCPESNNYIFVGKDTYFISSDGYLMPTRKDQPPPNLKYFGRSAQQQQE